MGKFTYKKTSSRNSAMKKMKSKGWKVKKIGDKSFEFTK